MIVDWRPVSVRGREFLGRVLSSPDGWLTWTWSEVRPNVESWRFDLSNVMKGPNEWTLCFFSLLLRLLVKDCNSLTLIVSLYLRVFAKLLAVFGGLITIFWAWKRPLAILRFSLWRYVRFCLVPITITELWTKCLLSRWLIPHDLC